MTGSVLVEVAWKLYELEIGGWRKQSERAGEYVALSVMVKEPRDGGRARPDDSDLDRAFSK